MPPTIGSEIDQPPHVFPAFEFFQGTIDTDQVDRFDLLEGRTFVKSTVNEVASKRFCKKQQMQWSKEGARVVLPMRVRTLNRELGAIFQRWYPDLDLEVEESSVAA